MSISNKKKLADLIGNLYTIEQQDGKYSALMQISGFETEEEAQIFMTNNWQKKQIPIELYNTPPTIH